MNVVVVLVALGAGAIGALVRYLVSLRMAEQQPWGVLVVNAAGSLVGGIVLGLVQAGSMGADARLIVLGGFAGGLTTFSTFSVETMQLILGGRGRTAVGSILANLALGVALALIGYSVAGGLR